MRRYFRNMWFALICRPDKMTAISGNQIFGSIGLQVATLILAWCFAKMVTVFAMFNGFVLAYVGCIGFNFMRNMPAKWMLGATALGLTLACPLVFAAISEPALAQLMLICYPFMLCLIATWIIKSRINSQKNMQEKKQRSSTSLGDFNDPTPVPGGAAKDMANLLRNADDTMLRMLKASLPVRHGAVIGRYKDHDIHEWIRTANGTVYEFDHVVPDGVVKTAPEEGCVIVAPGLLYRLKPQA